MSKRGFLQGPPESGVQSRRPDAESLLLRHVWQAGCSGLEQGLIKLLACLWIEFSLDCSPNDGELRWLTESFC